MSVAVHSFSGRKGGRKARNAYYLSVSCLTSVLLTAGVVAERHALESHGVRLLPWIALVIAVNLLPLSRWPHAILAPDLAIGTAAALILNPLDVALIHFVGAFDRQELRRRVDLPKSLFNRGQVALATAASSFIVHSIVPNPSRAGALLPLAFVALGTNTALNYSFVALAIRFEYRLPISVAVQRMQVGTITDFLLAFASWGVLGAMLAVLYDQIHLWALFAFLAPTLLTRQALRRSEMYLERSQAYHARESALFELHQRIAEERNDERRLIAADLHDEVLQPLFKVTLLAQVLKTELATGRLLELDQDLPELLAAAEVTSVSLRELIGDLRRSAIGRGGLIPALKSLVLAEGEASELEFHVTLNPVSVEPSTELIVYQIAKEAISNARSHSRATDIWLELTAMDQGILLKVEDNGQGFDPYTGRSGGHFGMAIMQERAAALGAQLSIDATPGQGTSIKLFVTSREAT